MIMKMVTLKRAKQRAIKSFNTHICKRDGYTCFTCGKVGRKGEMHAGHFIPATHEPTRFSEINVNCQCPACNLYRHGNLHEYAFRLVKKYGRTVIEELHAQSHAIKHWSTAELLDIERCYKSK